jgi:hypothetical protein
VHTCANNKTWTKVSRLLFLIHKKSHGLFEARCVELLALSIECVLYFVLWICCAVVSVFVITHVQ